LKKSETNVNDGARRKLILEPRKGKTTAGKKNLILEAWSHTVNLVRLVKNKRNGTGPVTKLRERTGLVSGS